MPSYPSIAAKRRVALWRRNPFVVVLGLLALALRLAVPLPPPAIAADTGTANADLVAAFGEHALCLAAAGLVPSSTDRPGAPSDDHAWHHASCCMFHAALGCAPPASGGVSPVLYALGVVFTPAPPPQRAGHFAALAQARAPPVGV
ncbi:MAG: hypothetical protein JO001_21475 [Alphaproteobacteria bacterium]|nr:hypothetical protein [Alphaproteobacteria bacterium]